MLITVPQLGSENRIRINLRRLADELDAACRERGLSLRQAANELGLSPSTLTRIRQGRRPDADALAVLLAWLDLNPRALLRADDPARLAHASETGRERRVRPARTRSVR